MDLQQLRIPRKGFLFGAGLSLAATAIGACTTYGKKPGGDSKPAAGAIAKKSDVPVGSGVIVGNIVVTQPTAGNFKGLSATCTHQGCTVSEVANGTINCKCHGSKFNLDGSVANGPAKSPLPTEAISVQGDSIVRG
jgi:Rieske Fe-S protein